MISQPLPKTIQVNGVDLTYVEQGKGVAVIFVHGGVTDYRSWMLQFEPFAQRYRAVSYSRRYHFPNPGAEGASGYRADDHRADLAYLIDALKLAPVHIVASSYGAYISLLLACTCPDLIRSLVLGEPPLPMLLGPEVVRSMVDQVEPSKEAFKRGEPEQAIRLFLDSVVGPGGFDRFPPAARKMILDNAPEFNLEVNTSPDLYFAPFSCEDAGRINIPTLLLNGEESPRFLYQMTDKLEQCLPNTERAVIPYASHGMHNQNPQAYNKTVLTFLTRH